MIISKMLVVVAIVSVMGAASAQSFHPAAGRETITKPWAAPVGHRQPHAADVPATTMGSLDFLDREDAYIDRKISGICRGC